MQDLAFEFDEEPFTPALDARFLYLDAGRRAALARLAAAATGGGRLALLTGRDGSGKTALILTLAGELAESAEVRVLNGGRVLAGGPPISAEDLLSAGELPSLVAEHAVRSWLDGAAEFSAASRPAVLLIDDIDRIPAGALAGYARVDRLIAGDCRRPVLIATATSARPRLPWRADLHLALAPFSAAETAVLLRQRLAAAGWRGGELFTAAAAEAITAHGEGNPRRLLALAAAALAIARREFAMPVLADLVEEAAAALFAPPPAVTAACTAPRMAALPRRPALALPPPALALSPPATAAQKLPPLPAFLRQPPPPEPVGRAAPGWLAAASLAIDALIAGGVLALSLVP